jgi:hypothetical protein
LHLRYHKIQKGTLSLKDPLKRKCFSWGLTVLVLIIQDYHKVPCLLVQFPELMAHHIFKDNSYVESEEYDYRGTDKDSVAVAYYSRRAGSSETVARANIAKQLNVPLYQINVGHHL